MVESRQTDPFEYDWRDRFRDEEDTAVPEEPLYCGNCAQFVRCLIKGHEGVGWCSRYDEFTTVDNIEDDECWE